ncbi:ATP-binding protein [Gallaecimonas kandeliae]|uniref:sensor histidine kinase n=1 Tax=Gallaecimonas kandeliae TaxID=3029055 RepID=UPI0026472D6C|nr:ATP-binding protein [Gallaecimonas kandeliae]WKE66738.1 ATP-binding protein [Gallaecimonas kandeliae]
MALAQQWFPSTAPAARQLDKLLSILPVGVLVLDGSGWVKEANTKAMELLGEPLLDCRWLDVVARAFRPRADDGAEVSLVNGLRVKLDICPLDGEPGQLIVISDLTETRAMQTRIAHLQKLSSLGRMVASLAHQIRTPLSAAMLYAGQLDQTLPAATHDRFQQKLVARLKDLESQMNNMLLFAKSGEQKLADKLEAGALVAELQQACESMLESHHAELTVQMDQPQSQLLGAQSALVSALSNLVHNALQAGARHLVLEVKAQAPWLSFCLADDGPGIAEELLFKVAEPFFTTKSHGTGLGLSVVRSVAQAHGGQLHMANGATGARMTLILPLLEDNA